MRGGGAIICASAAIGLALVVGYALRRCGMAIDEVLGDVIALPAGAKIGGQQKPGGEAGNRPATDSNGMSLTHSDGWQ